MKARDIMTQPESPDIFRQAECAGIRSNQQPLYIGYAAHRLQKRGVILHRIDP